MASSGAAGRQNIVVDLIDCPFCGEKFPCDIIENHVEKCEEIECLYGCGNSFAPSDIKNHQKNECPYRFDAGNASAGQAATRNSPVDSEISKVVCPWECGQSFSRGEIEMHAANCEKGNDDCLYGCGLNMPRDELKIHQKTCTARTRAAEPDPLMEVSQEMCLNCNKIFPESQILAHQMACFANPDPLESSSEKISISNCDNAPLVDRIIYDDYNPSTEDDSDSKAEDIYKELEPSRPKWINSVRHRTTTKYSSKNEDSDDESKPIYRTPSEICERREYFSAMGRNDSRHLPKNDDSKIKFETTYSTKSKTPKKKVQSNAYRSSARNNSDEESERIQKPEIPRKKVSYTNTKKNADTIQQAQLQRKIVKERDPTIDLDEALFQSVANRTQQRTSFPNDKTEYSDNISDDDDAGESIEQLWERTKVILQDRLAMIQERKQYKKSKSSSRGSL